VVIAIAAFMLGGAIWWVVQRSDEPTPTDNTNTTTNQAGVQPAEVRQPPPDPVQQEDADRDGLTDEEEATAQTKPDDADSDDDGLSDLAELRVYQTDPLTADSDDDGFRDGEEVKNGKNPKGTGDLLDVPQAINALN
jgi:hypothetical protein